MKLSEWEIWHTYTTYLRIDKVDLEHAASRLIEARVGHLALHRDGLTVWRGRDGIGRGMSRIGLASDGLHADIRLERQEESLPELTGFAAEAWYQACCFRFSELRLFGTASPLPDPYIRVFLGQCDFVRDEEGDRISVYPIAIIYATGILIVELRMISPDREVGLDEFISGGVNLFLGAFDRIEVPPGLSKLATRAWYHSASRWKFYQRAAHLLLERGHDLAVAQRTSTKDVGDFAFEMAPLSTSGEPRHSEQLSTLVLTVFHTIAFVLCRPRTGFGYLVRGEREIPEIGGFWSGRPHIHLIRFQDQQETAHDNEDRHGAVFGTIMLRVHPVDPGIARKHLPANNRIFNDYASYISSALSLWVWSLSGLRQQEPRADPNRGHLIYERQATLELLEYCYMLHRAILESTGTSHDTDYVLSARQNLLWLEQAMAEASHFGEIRDLLINGWRAMGMDTVRVRIRESLEVSRLQAVTNETRLAERVGRALTIIFGLVAVPPIAEQLLKPLWNVLTLPRPEAGDEFSLLLISVAIVLVGIPVILLWRSLGRR